MGKQARNFSLQRGRGRVRSRFDLIPAQALLVPYVLPLQLSAYPDGKHCSSEESESLQTVNIIQHLELHRQVPTERVCNSPQHSIMARLANLQPATHRYIARHLLSGTSQ